ncbi:MAG: AAA family ATPase [Candidatus Woesearchaeota archaeon]
MEKQELKIILIEQNQKKTVDEQKDIIEREILNKINKEDNFIKIISGIRRCGKSTFLRSLWEKNDGYFVNFDDERFINFTIEDFQKLNELLIELFGLKENYFFDEIQNIYGWERFVRRLHDYGKKIFITGSNATMLSKELGTHLTGRHILIEMYPFSFKEFLEYKKIKIKRRLKNEKRRKYQRK